MVESLNVKLSSISAMSSLMVRISSQRGSVSVIWNRNPRIEVDVGS